MQAEVMATRSHLHYIVISTTLTDLIQRHQMRSNGDAVFCSLTPSQPWQPTPVTICGVMKVN
jgi:hypothetical protein